MRARGLSLLLLLTACYRGESATAVGHPMEAAACNADDDFTRPVIDTNEGRLRIHSTAPLTRTRGRAGGRQWIGPAVPQYVDKRAGTLELMLLDQIDGGYLALYRDPYNAGSCQLGDNTNCTYEVRRYRDGEIAWALPLNRVLSRSDHLEVQDIRFSGGVLYFNEACQSYSNGAGGDCSSLVAVDPVAGRVLWRTPPLTSNHRFAIRGCYIVTGYGFTAEPDAVYLVDRARGKVVQKVPVATAPEGYKLVGPQQVDVTLYAGAVRRYRLDNALRTGGRLVPLDAADAFGGAGYGGAGYGGAVYGGLGYGGP